MRWPYNFHIFAGLYARAEVRGARVVARMCRPAHKSGQKLNRIPRGRQFEDSGAELESYTEPNIGANRNIVGGTGFAAMFGM
jgi:hypothetical protein